MEHINIQKKAMKTWYQTTLLCNTDKLKLIGLTLLLTDSPLADPHHLLKIDFLPPPTTHPPTLLSFVPTI